MKNSSASEFLNLDLDIESDSDLTALGGFLATKCAVLFNGRTAKGYRVTAEPLIRGKLNASIGQCTNKFLRILSVLPPELVNTWKTCKLRDFDYGFVGGVESAPLVVSLTNQQLSKMAELGLIMKVTVYSYRDDCAKPSV